MYIVSKNKKWVVLDSHSYKIEERFKILDLNYQKMNCLEIFNNLLINNFNQLNPYNMRRVFYFYKYLIISMDNMSNTLCTFCWLKKISY
jgi:hypothetical protein